LNPTGQWLTLWIESGWPLFQPFFSVLVAVGCERLLPILPQWDPFILFRGMASNLEQKVNPSKAANSFQQQLISGSLSILLMLSLVLPLAALLIWLSDAGWTLSAALLYLSLQWQPVRRDIATISRSLQQQNKDYAKQLLALRVRRETQSLSEMGIAKAAIEMASLRYFYSYVSVVIGFLLLGPLAALSLRCLFELGQAWLDKPLQTNGYTLPLNRLRKVVEWLPGRLWLCLLRLSAGWQVSGRLIHQQAGGTRSRMPILAATASMDKLNLGGPAIYLQQKVRYPRIAAGKNPAACDIMPALNRLEVVGATLIISTGLIYLTISTVPIILAF